MRVLLVEDDPLLGDGIRIGLKQQGHTIEWQKDGESAVFHLTNDEYDVVVLDLGLPKKHGLDVLKETRATGNPVPVLILTAQDAIEDRVTGLDAGADDYLTKPFDLNELFARLRALARRAGGRTESAITHNDLKLEPASHTLTRSGETIDLSRREFTVLLELLESRGRVLSRDRLEQGLYGWDDTVESNAIEVHIHHLRKKLGSELIRTVRGVGYMIQKPDHSDSKYD
jgi:DNA-binding response OmpR family regulator